MSTPINKIPVTCTTGYDLINDKCYSKCIGQTRQCVDNPINCCKYNPRGDGN